MGTDDSSWTRALMASSGIAIGHDTTPRHASPEWREAADPETPLLRVQRLATCKERDVRVVIARRVDCPMGVLASLAFDHDSEVRAGVAGNPRITDAVSTHLARDRDAKVVKALARNHAIDLTLLEGLALHKKDDIRRVASRNLDERIHGSDATAVTPESLSLASSRGDEEQPSMPMELRDRVPMRSEWAVDAPADTSREEGAARVGALRQLMPRLHPN